MHTATYRRTRGELETYFDRTAAEAWARLTSTAPVGRIRATVRAGRDRMRGLMLDALPLDLRGRRILDAGCGTGALAVEAARRGATVVAIDLSPTLVGLAHDRRPAIAGGGSIEFRVGDMTDAGLGRFDHVVAMDSLIHYRAEDIVGVLANLAARTAHSMVFTVAPSTLPLEMMHAVGRLFPRGNRAPAIQPVAAPNLQRLIGAHPDLAAWRCGRSERVSSGFYKSQMLELERR